MEKIIKVTEPSLPDLEEFLPYLEKIWSSKWLTNNGPMHQEFEVKLAEFLGVEYISLFANGTLALITALQALDIKGEVITTPYTFVATPHSVFWNNITPVFCDIKPDDCNIDEEQIESLITERTTAILGVHVYGSPCKHRKIEAIAKKHNLKVIYDAAHAFNIKENGKSILTNGDMSIMSFHATKIFNTFEGGAIICKSKEMKAQIDFLKNFGFQDEVTVVKPGINSKMNEFQAALGLLQLTKIEANIEKCAGFTQSYNEGLSELEGIDIMQLKENTEYNYSYYPIFVNEKYPLTRDALYELLKENNIYTRRYFYPLVTAFEPYDSLVRKESLPIANRLAERVICLPMYAGLEKEDMERVIRIIIENQKPR